jgi:hypothetical protein
MNHSHPSNVTLKGLQEKYEEYQTSLSLNSESPSDDDWVTEEESDEPFKEWVAWHHGVSELKLLKENGYKLDVLGHITLLHIALWRQKIDVLCFLLEEYPSLRAVDSEWIARRALFTLPKKDLERLEAAGMDFQVKLLSNPLRLVLRSGLELFGGTKRVPIVTHRVGRRFAKKNVRPVIQFELQEGKDLLGSLSQLEMSPEESEAVKKFLFAHLSEQDRDLLRASQKDDEAAAVPESSEAALESEMFSRLSNQ